MNMATTSRSDQPSPLKSDAATESYKESDVPKPTTKFPAFSRGSDYTGVQGPRESHEVRKKYDGPLIPNTRNNRTDFNKTSMPSI